MLVGVWFSWAQVTCWWIAPGVPGHDTLVVEHLAAQSGWAWEHAGAVSLVGASLLRAVWVARVQTSLRGLSAASFDHALHAHGMCLTYKVPVEQVDGAVRVLHSEILMPLRSADAGLQVPV